MKKFKHGKTEYVYSVDKQKRKTFALTIHPNQSILLKTPETASAKDINDFLKKKSLWIDRQMDFFKQFKVSPRNKEYVSGEKFLYLGRRYMLKVSHGKDNSVLLKSGRIMIVTEKGLKNTKHNKMLLDEWFLNKAENIFKERFEKMLEKFNYDYVPELAIRKMSKRWGSYHSKGKVLLNPILIHASKRSIDYVVTHELCHAKHQNHSVDYYQFLKSKFPKWEIEKQKLEVLIFNDF
jgi:predicted metal-dependent hydrolase